MTVVAPTPERIRLAIICKGPPPNTYAGQPTEFGLQDKQQVLHHGTPQDDGALGFTCEVAVKRHVNSRAPDFGGPFVHGPAGGRFLYLGWRPPGGDWIRRYKIPLATITWERIAGASQIPNGMLVARISAARSGTVALLGAGWTPDEVLF